jgi:hypothetical protein
MERMTADDRETAEANRLYWETDTSVAEIADHLDLSRRALYGAVHPLPTGAACSRCGGELEYENRSARKAAQGTCGRCGGSQHLEDDETAETAGRPPLAVVAGDPRGDAVRDMREPDLRHRAVVLGGAAIAGVALGTVAAILATRGD